MSTTAVGHCPHCAAVINRNWLACLVCHATIRPTTEPGISRLPAPVPIQAGDRIEWERADLTVQSGVVDFLYTDDRATRWAFVSIGESWSSVNLKFVKGAA